MPSIRIEAKENLNKVAMSKAIQDNTLFNLKESKSFTDILLEKGLVDIELDNSVNVIGLLQALYAANAKVQFLD
jgi:hypothetical protein